MTHKELADKFGIKENEIVQLEDKGWYIRACLSNRKAAEWISSQVKNKIINGGPYDGMPMGGIFGGYVDDVPVFILFC